MRQSFLIAILPGEKESVPVMGISKIPVELEGSLELDFCIRKFEKTPMRGGQGGVSVS
jgi:hypothetical protein